jgi:hypothetical protein
MLLTHGSQMIRILRPWFDGRRRKITIEFSAFQAAITNREK